jgi:hypothetical protein
MNFISRSLRFKLWAAMIVIIMSQNCRNFTLVVEKLT